MRRMPWMVYLWPGLPRLWLRGHWADLAMALGAAGVLNTMLIVSFGWSELISSGMRNILWIVAALLWTAWAAAGYVQTKRQTNGKQRTPAKDTFTQALDLYLKGDYFQAECLLVEMLGRNERDLEARLALATLYRHNRRYDEATKQLDILVRYGGAEKWELEIEREQVLIAEGLQDTEEDGTMGENIESPETVSQAA
jgi:hypothetical protein